MRDALRRTPEPAERGGRRLVGDSWRLAVARVLAVLVAIGIGGFAFVSAGLMPIAASEGHWAVTRVFLHYVMRRSVATATIGLEAPPLDDPALVAKGAGHYATGCLPCHGAPGVPRSPVVERMLPVPPYLPDVTGELTAEETFWVIKHGLKYTAMPGWLAQARDDEVWAMVAFVRRLPRLDAGRFRALAHGELAERMRTIGGVTDLAPLGAEPSAPTPVLANCSRCHGRDGAGRDGAFPRLAGQPEAYLRATLHAYARGARHSGIMQPALAGLDTREIDALARHYAAQAAAPGSAPDAGAADPTPADAAAIARGRLLARDGDAARRIPRCDACHGDASSPMHPVLAGQDAAYLALQLRLFRAGTRGGTAWAPVMEAAAEPLDDRDIADLAAYYASLDPR